MLAFLNDRRRPEFGAAALDYDAFRATRRFPGLDGLRACAVLMVLVYHCPKFATDWARALQLTGDAGVDVFFVLSGFLITTLLLRERPAPIGRRLGRFYMRRALRIFPLYYAAIALYAVTAHLGSDPDAGPLYLHYLPWFLTYNVDVALGLHPEAFPHFGIAWSLGVEEKFYLLWPLLVVWLPVRRLATVAAVAIGAIALWRLWLIGHWPGDVQGRIYYAFDVRMDGILVGALLACVLHRPRGYEAIRRLAARPIVPALAVLGFLVAALTTTNASFARYVLLPGFATVALAAVVVHPHRPGAAPLRMPMLAALGAISYGIYVFHPIGTGIAARITGYATDGQIIACALVATLVTAAIAAVSFRCFEGPFLALKHRFASNAPAGPPRLEPRPARDAEPRWVFSRPAPPRRATPAPPPTAAPDAPAPERVSDPRLVSRGGALR